MKKHIKTQSQVGMNEIRDGVLSSSAAVVCNAIAVYGIKSGIAVSAFAFPSFLVSSLFCVGGYTALSGLCKVSGDKFNNYRVKKLVKKYGKIEHF